MPRSLKIPAYHSKDLAVMVASMLPMAMLVNYFLYGESYFLEASTFAWTTLTSFAYFALAFMSYGLVAISLRNRFPDDRQLFKRLAICLSIFFLMSAVYIALLLLAYDNFHFFGYEYSEHDFTRGYITLMVINIFLTFLNEGLYRFEKYRATITETEQLKKEFMHSQLLGLKSQMNPHFLFNGLNTLSCLIHEDAEKAEDFLDHMSKVYRYLLRNNEEQLVTVATELGFIRSFFYLLKARYGNAIHLTIDVNEESMIKQIPPLTLQMVVESSLTHNAISRTKPLFITIISAGERLGVVNNIQPKINNTDDDRVIMENISNKFRLLCQQEIMIQETTEQRKVLLPLIPQKELVTT
ncbi:MAG: histidine kinase [Flavisolibacter sp.]